MSKMTIVNNAHITQTVLAAAGQRAGADSGDPQLGIQELAPEANGSLGIWECQPGGWPVINRQDTEFTYIIAGKAILTDDSTGEKTTVGAGDLIILPVGWTGRWDVLETVRKVYAIF
ncbi:cupin domain-containing protein [Vitreoscilla massiliensis]|uniref:Cupin domain-containing protein n=1 Tax=Vitreoscilla massiliensis TaxID=1689272 RepID=A0ABY4E2G4_9NEIS|nr:cupin domain-containing protein [Vitreoscilla massiliensis]UOO89717.1 cupin domain-containing protein [Vitreoscilla massiliensis]